MRGNGHAPIFVVFVFVFSTFSYAYQGENQPPLNETLSDEHLHFTDYGLSNSSYHSNEFNFELLDISKLKLSRVILDRYDQGLFFAGHAVNDFDISVNGTTISFDKCDLFVGKSDLEQNLIWMKSVTNQTDCNNDRSIASAGPNERNTHISQLEMIDEFNLIITGTVCHIHFNPICHSFGESNHGVKGFVAGINATNGIQNFNTTFHLQKSSQMSDYININPNIGLLYNSSQVAIGVRIDRTDGVSQISIDGNLCDFVSNGILQGCNYVLIINVTDGLIADSKFHPLFDSPSCNDNFMGYDMRLAGDNNHSVMYNYANSCTTKIHVWNITNGTVLEIEKSLFLEPLGYSPANRGSPNDIVYSGDGEWMLLWSNSSATRIYTLADNLTIDTFVEFTGLCCNERQGSRLVADTYRNYLFISNANDFSGQGFNLNGAYVVIFTTNNTVISAIQLPTLGTEYTSFDVITTYNAAVPYPYFDAHDDAFIVGPYNRVLFPDWDNDQSPDYRDPFPYDNTQSEDADGDGYGDNPSGNNPDGCISQFGNSTEDAFGCPDYDGDGYSNNGDQFPGFVSQWNDSDWDGYGDNINGYQGDACPTVLGTSNRNETGAINAEDATFGCPDDDFDGYANIIDDCITNYGASAYSIEDGINQTYVGCPDADNDKYEDSTDPCPLQYGTSWLDRLGCADLDEDGISDLRDPKPTSATSDSEDWDEDGHMDLRNWTNADGLQYWINGTDVFPNNPFEWSDLDDDGVGDNSDAFPNDATETADTDGDSIGDVADQCPYAWGNATEGDAAGCLDSDGDGWADQDDAFSSNPSEWLDSDGDGIGDNSDWAPEDASETRDTDGDGVGDNADTFPNNENETADSDGDGIGDNADVFPNDESEYADFDQDGVGNNADAFPNNANESTDSDGDGIGDNADWAPNDDSETRDTDGDGVGDNADMFPNNANETLDSDGDGVGDNADVFRFDPTETMDSDLDGVGDNADAFPDDLSETTDSDGDMIGDNADQCPSQSGDLFTIPIGCPDTDRDGYADSNDRFFTDPTEWNDSDEDGLGDNRDYCPNQNGNATLGFGLGCIDSDGDGWADLEDIWPSNAKAWSDGDGDMFTDQPGLAFSDDCPSQNGSSNISMNGCGDMDNDGIPDMLDPDADGDGIFNTWEYQMDPMTDPFNATSVPADNDKDGIPDIFDEDDDNDGFPDTLEEERGSDPYDDTDDPLNQYGGGVYYLPGDGFSTQYDPEGVELSFGAFLSLLSSEFLAPLLIAPITIYFLLSKRRRFNRMKIDIEESNDLAELELYEEEINDYISGNKLKITHSLLLRNILEHQQDMLRGHTAIEHHVEPEEKELPDLAYATVRESPSDVPHPGLSGTVGKDGYEYIKWPEDDPVDWYRKANSGDVWLRWEKY